MGLPTQAIPTAASGATPGLHVSAHQSGGSDQVNIGSLAGVAADAQRVEMRYEGAVVGVRPQINFIEGTNIAIAATDNATLNRVDVAVSNSSGIVTADPLANGFRLSPDSANPAYTVTGVTETRTTVYMLPYTGNRISLYNGTSWVGIDSPGAAYQLTGRNSGRPFDIFCFNAGGIATLEALDWNNTTARATALVQQNGVWCKSGALTRRYLGTCVPDSSTTYKWEPKQIQPSPSRGAEISIWNVDNRIGVPWETIEATDSWTQTTASTWRSANASTANPRFKFVIGLQDSTSISAMLSASSRHPTANIARRVGIGYNTTTDPTFSSNGSYGSYGAASWENTFQVQHRAALITANTSKIGALFLQWLEWTANGTTTTWYGDQGGTLDQSGMCGMFWC